MPNATKALRRQLLPLVAAITLHFAGAHAAVIAVNNAGEGSIPGKCTLADAVFAVNHAAVKNACTAGDGNNDTIDLFLFTTPTTIAFTVPTSADLNSAIELTAPATIRARLDANAQPLVTLTRNIGNGPPYFRMVSATSDLAISGLAISGGKIPGRGGGIAATGYASLVLTNSTISGNASTSSSGGGIAAECGYITLTNSRVEGNNCTGNGAGVYTSNQIASTMTHCGSSITLNRSVVSGNHSANGKGGGIYSFGGAVYAQYATVDGNIAYSGSGGIYAYQHVQLNYSTVSNNSAVGMNAQDGGLTTQYGAVIVNSTISGNSATDGAASMRDLTMSFSTVTGNTAANPASYPIGGIYFFGTALVVGSIVTGNTFTNIAGQTSVTGNHNIIAPTFNTSPLPADTVNCDPKLGPLADNGGPTKTMALLDGSCALNTGPPTAPDIFSDQRGRQFERKFGVATDIGAFEVQTNDRIFYDGFNM